MQHEPAEHFFAETPQRSSTALLLERRCGQHNGYGHLLEIERDMGALPITFSLFLSQALNLLVTVAWLVLLGLALRSLRYRHLSDAAKALWVGMILVIPFLGPIALWIVAPGQPMAQTAAFNRRLLPEPWEARSVTVEAKNIDFSQKRQQHSPT